MWHVPSSTDAYDTGISYSIFFFQRVKLTMAIVIAMRKSKPQSHINGQFMWESTSLHLT